MIELKEKKIQSAYLDKIEQEIKEELGKKEIHWSLSESDNNYKFIISK
jgi:hypothetical protein